MGKLFEQQEQIKQIVLHQLKAHWLDVDEQIIEAALPAALKAVEVGFYGNPSRRFFDGEEVLFSPYHSVQWMVFLYRLSREIHVKNPGAKEADQVYYLNKIMHANDWFYAVDLPPHFLCEHSLGCVLGRAKYGDYLFAYQGTTVGGNWNNGVLCYPTLGDNVTLFANSTVLGDTRIGNNVLISADTYIINEDIPDNCIVFGRSPNITIRPMEEEKIKQYTQHIWGWK